MLSAFTLDPSSEMSQGYVLFLHKNVLQRWLLRLPGFYMYIETSRPRLEGEKARLLSPVFSIAPKNPYGPTNTAYCFSFFYHMYGQHIGKIIQCSAFYLPIPVKLHSLQEDSFVQRI